MKHLPLIALLACGDMLDELDRRDTSIQTFEFPHEIEPSDALTFAASQGFTGCGAQMDGPNLYVKCWGVE